MSGKEVSRWSRSEVRALLQAWREGLEHQPEPLRRGKLNGFVSARFHELCATHSPARTACSIVYKKKYWRSIVQFICDYNLQTPGGDWYALDTARRRLVFEQRKTTSYKFTDLDQRTAFEVAKIIMLEDGTPGLADLVYGPHGAVSTGVGASSRRGASVFDSDDSDAAVEESRHQQLRLKHKHDPNVQLRVGVPLSPPSSTSAAAADETAADADDTAADAAALTQLRHSTRPRATIQMDDASTATSDDDDDDAAHANDLDDDDLDSYEHTHNDDNDAAVSIGTHEKEEDADAHHANPTAARHRSPDDDAQPPSFRYPHEQQQRQQHPPPQHSVTLSKSATFVDASPPPCAELLTIAKRVAAQTSTLYALVRDEQTHAQQTQLQTQQERAQLAQHRAQLLSLLQQTQRTAVDDASAMRAERDAWAAVQSQLRLNQQALAHEQTARDAEHTTRLALLEAIRADQLERMELLDAWATDRCARLEVREQLQQQHGCVPVDAVVGTAEAKEEGNATTDEPVQSTGERRLKDATTKSVVSKATSNGHATTSQGPIKTTLPSSSAAAEKVASSDREEVESVRHSLRRDSQQSERDKDKDAAAASAIDKRTVESQRSDATRTSQHDAKSALVTKVRTAKNDTATSADRSSRKDEQRQRQQPHSRSHEPINESARPGEKRSRKFGAPAHSNSNSNSSSNSSSNSNSSRDVRQRRV